MSIISIDRIAKTIRGNEILKDATADFERGHITAITGPNGSGKSVLFRIICGFMRPDSGTVTIDPEFLPADSRYPENFGIMIDGPGYLPFATGFANLERLAEIRGVAGPVEITRALEAVGLEPNAKQRVRNYSLGMKQKLGIAQAIMEDQQVLLLDEPFNGLDRASSARVADLLIVARDAGKTVIFTSHIQGDVEKLADETYEISEGILDRVE